LSDDDGDGMFVVVVVVMNRSMLFNVDDEFVGDD
jgi:hypothetical protein